ncbi:hypothetical protein D9M68_938050 [compost metagenome]
MGARLGAGRKFLGHGCNRARPVLVVLRIDAAGGIGQGGERGHGCHFRRKDERGAKRAISIFCHLYDENWQFGPALDSYTVHRSRRGAGQAPPYRPKP